LAPARPARRAGQSRRLRAIASVLALTSAILLVSAVAVAVSLLHQGHADERAERNLVAVLRAAEAVKRELGSFEGATATELESRVHGVRVVGASFPSEGETVISMAVGGDGWFGAVRSPSGHCFAAGTVHGDPRMLQAVLTGNCTGDAARASLVPVSNSNAPAMSSQPGEPASG